MSLYFFRVQTGQYYMMDTYSMGGAIIEGIGNEVLLTLIIGGAAILLALGWYSTNLTSRQTPVASVRFHRQSVTLNTLPGSSTTDLQPTNVNEPVSVATKTGFGIFSVFVICYWHAFLLIIYNKHF